MLLKFQYIISFFTKKAVMLIVLLLFFILPFEQMVWAVESSSANGSASVKPASIHLTSTNHAPIPGVTGSISKSWQAYSLPHKRMISPLTALPVMANGESALSSNADNFHGAWNAAVDPRTGNASFSATLASTLFNRGESKRDLNLSYAGGPSARGADIFDLGPHWQWNTGHEHPAATEVAGHLTTAITLGDGHGFTMVSDRENGRTLWHPLRHKLRDVKITGHPGDWVISEATGVRQRILNGYEQWEESISGQRVYFYYNKHGANESTRHLTYICAHELSIEEQRADGNACKNDGIHISYRGSNVIVQSHQTIVLHRINNSGIQMIDKIIMPPLSSPGVDDAKNATIELAYDNHGLRPWLLSRVDYPTGLSKTFLYNGESNHPGVQTTGLSSGVNGAHIPVVTEEITESTKTGEYKIPADRVWYRYSVPENGGQEHNYLGYQGPHSVIPGRDNLFDRHNSYTYSVMKDNGLTYTTTTFNKYHLPLTITERDSRNHAILASSRQDYSPWRGTVFSELPATYSMADRETKSAYTLTEQGNDAITAPALVIDSKKYNREGNVIWQQDSYGRVMVTKYCPSEGDEHCPAMDKSWPQMSLPEKVLVLPAKQSPEGSVPFLTMAAGGVPEVAMETVYDYVRMQAVSERKHLYEQADLTDKKLSDKRLSDREPSLFLRVSAKTEGTLPVADLDFYHRGYYENHNHCDNHNHYDSHSHYDSRNGSENRQFPEITHVSLKTTYGYNMDINDAAYGQMNQLTMAKTSETMPRVNNKLLQLNNIPDVHHHFSANTTEEVVSFAVDEHFDAVHGTHTKALRIIPEQSTPHAAGSFKTLDQGAGLQLGTTVYALDTGVKLSREDTLGEVKTLWHYDSWHRPVEEITQPRTGGRARVIKWTYIFTSEENAVVKTLPNGEQMKVVLSADNKVLSTWHRFASGANTMVRGVKGWIPDTVLTYTVSGKVAEKTTWHAGDRQPDSSLPQAIALKTRYGYDMLNRLVWTQQPNGIVDVAVRDDPAMRIFNYQVIPATKAHPEQLGSAIKVLETNILNKQTASYLLPLDPFVNKSGRPLYSKALQLQLIQLKQQLLSTGTLQPQNSYGLLPMSGNTGLLSFVTSALKARSWMGHTRWKYDGHGRKIEQILGNGATTHWHYDRDNPVATTLPDGRLIHDEFNVNNEKTIRCVQPAGASRCHVLGEKGYDYQGQLTWQADEYGRVVHYTYDDNGRLLRETLPPVKDSPAGHVITYKYNSIGMIEKDLDGQPYLLRHYDPETWKLTDTEDAISHVHYTYDKQSGLPIRVTHSAPEILKSPISYPSYTEETVYDDRYLTPIKSSDGTGNVYTATHDRLGRITATFIQLPATHQPLMLMQQSYDAFNRVSTICNGIGIKRVLTYNSLGELQSTLDSKAGQLLDKISYAYDPDTGNILTLTREEGDVSAVQHYTYDLSGNLTTMTCHAEGRENQAGALCPRDTDIKGSHLTGAPVITRQQYTFDHWNNIQTVEESGVRDLASATPYTKTTRYRYAVQGTAEHPEAYDPNRLLGYQTQWNNQRYSNTPENITYDEAGRIIKDAEGNRLGYNAFGQQNHFINAATFESTEYTYDSQGHQVAEQPFARDHTPLQAPLYMLYTGNTITAQMQRGKNKKLHISSETGGIAHSEDGVITRWYLHSYKGDVLACFDNNGIRQSSNVYSPYGMRYNRLNTDKQILPLLLALSGQKPWWQSHQPGFNGQMSDPATGYQFLGGGYRAYNPVYRHFMAKDSFSPFIKVDGYGYGDNNPIMNTDPSGHMSKGWQIALEGIGIAAGFLIGTLIPAAMGLLLWGMANPILYRIPSLVGMISAVCTPVTGGMGTLSGGLNIGRIVHPKNQMLAMASSSFNLINGFLSTVLSIPAIASALTGLVAYNSGYIATLSHSLALSGGASIFVAGAVPIALTGTYLSRKGKPGGDDKLERIARIVSLTAMMVTVVTDAAALGAKGIAVLSGYKVGIMSLERESWKGDYEGETKGYGPHRYGPHGYGRLKDIKSSRDTNITEFQGRWRNGKPTHGTLYRSNELQYTGEVNSHLLENGWGRRSRSGPKTEWENGSRVSVEHEIIYRSIPEEKDGTGTIPGSHSSSPSRGIPPPPYTEKPTADQM